MTTPQTPQQWIGRTQTCHDHLDVTHVEKVALALNEPTPQAGDALPLLWQWCFFQQGVPYAEIGADGHPRRGGFMPPADDRNRMWAGGRLTFHQALRAGIPARRESTILGVQEKVGKTGKLLFVTVGHQYLQEDRLCISEEQDVLYREPTPPKLRGDATPAQPDWSETVQPSSVMLFRYSAVTFNGHRIHYDQPYATQAEGYPDLVVHGPLLATLMCAAFTRAHPDATPASLSFRGLRPVCLPHPFLVQGRRTAANTADLWVAQDDTLAHQASITFS